MRLAWKLILVMIENYRGKLFRHRLNTICGWLVYHLVFLFLVIDPIFGRDWTGVAGVAVGAVIFDLVPVINRSPRWACFCMIEDDKLTIYHAMGSLRVSQDEIEAYHIQPPAIIPAGPRMSRHHRYFGPRLGYLTVIIRNSRRAFCIPSSAVDRALIKWLKSADGVVEYDTEPQRTLPAARVLQALFIFIMTYLVWVHGLFPPKTPP